MWRLLHTADWYVDAVRDESPTYVVERLGPAGCSAWTRPGPSRRAPARPGWPGQHTGTSGEIDYGQIGAFCAFAMPDVP